MDTTAHHKHAGSSLLGMLRLIRPGNCTITFLSIASMGLIANIPAIRIQDLMVAAAAGFFMTAFGNASNDYLDIEIDRINRPNRPLPSGQISQSQAVIVLVAAMLISAALGFSLGAIAFLFITVTAALLSGYNAILKRIPLAGNITVGVLTGFAFVFGGIAIGAPGAAVYPALFAMLINVIRELLKDTVDIEGDAVLSVVTFPKMYGMKATRLLAGILAAFLIALTALPYFTGLYNQYYAVAVLVGVDIPLFGAGIYLWNHFSRQRILKVCILLKYLMISGLVAIVIGSVPYLQRGF